MGSGIAESIATHGLSVVVREVDDAMAAKARERVEASLERGVSCQRMTAEARDETLSRMKFTSDFADLSETELVIEAVPEILDLKLQVLQATAEAVAPTTLLASNTSSLTIASLAGRLPNPERVLGMHFFSPVPVMKLVEVVVALDTSREAFELASEFARNIGKTPLESKDRSGFIVNVLLVPYLMAAMRLYEENFTTAEAIDEGMVLGCGHPIGPLKLCDQLGLDVMVNVCDSLYDEFKKPEYATPPILRRMVEAGRLGRKSGRGFYDYATAQ